MIKKFIIYMFMDNRYGVYKITDACDFYFYAVCKVYTVSQ